MLALAAAGADARLFGLAVPYHRRQVNEYWLDDYRPWVYGGGFGWQIGVGFATYIMTSAIVLLVALAALTGEPLVALGLGTLFGFVRGLGVLPGARLTTPAKLAAFHTKFDARAELEPQARHRRAARRRGDRDRRRRRRRGRGRSRRWWSPGSSRSARAGAAQPRELASS